MSLARSPHHRLRGAASATLLVVVLASCGGADAPSTASATQAQAQPDQTPEGVPDGAPEGGLGDGSIPGASGEIVAIDDRTAQVRNPFTGQVAVSWTDQTAVTATVDGSLDDVQVGACVVVTGAGQNGDGVAALISVTEPVDGSCAGQGTGGMGRAPMGAGGATPDSFELPEGGVPDGPPGQPGSDPAQGDGPGFGAPLMGAIVGLDGDTLTVDAIVFAFEGGSPPGTDDGTDPSTEVRAVTIGTDTRITTVVNVDISAIEVGICITAQGQTDDVGAVTADTIAMSQPVEGECGSFGGPGSGRPLPGAEADA